MFFQQDKQVAVVLNHHHGSILFVMLMRNLLFCAFRCDIQETFPFCSSVAVLMHRYEDRKGRTFSFVALNADLPVVQVHQILYQ